MSEATGMPAMNPPRANGPGSTAVGTTEPEPLTEDQVAASESPAPGAAAPTLAPPEAQGGVTAAALDQGVTGTWRTGVQVTAMWSTNEVRNAWMHATGVGWRKIYNGRDGAFTALVTLATQARQTGRTINFREEADGMVYEIYLW